MEKFLTSIGISDVKSIVHNPSYDQLYEDELKPNLEGFARGQLTELGAVNVLTGEYTGRSPKDKFIVMDDTTRDNYWWNGNGTKNDNKPIDLGVCIYRLRPAPLWRNKRSTSWCKCTSKMIENIESRYFSSFLFYRLPRSNPLPLFRRLRTKYSKIPEGSPQEFSKSIFRCLQ